MTPSDPRLRPDLEGLAALRLAVAVLRDPLGLDPERAAFRAISEPGRAVAAVTASLAPPAAVAGPVPAAADGLSVEPDGAGSAQVAAAVAAAQAGDGEAFGQLYDRYVDLVYRYVYYRVGAVALAEDLTSETFLRALRRIGTFSWQGRDFGAWLVTIARNLVADHYKSARHRLEISTADMLAADRVTEGPENEVIDALTAATLLEAVRRLNPEQQECVVLRFLHGLSVAETARAMDRNEGAIKALQYRAVRRLASLVPPELSPRAGT